MPQYIVFKAIHTSQLISALSLFVLGILADDADASLSLDDFALLANRFY